MQRLSVPNLGGPAEPSNDAKLLGSMLQAIHSQLVMISAQLDITLKLAAGVLTPEEIQEGFADAQRQGEEAASAASTPDEQ